MIDDMNERKLDEQMSEDDIDMIRWLKSASPKELCKALRSVEKEIFRDGS